MKFLNYFQLAIIFFFILIQYGCHRTINNANAIEVKDFPYKTDLIPIQEFENDIFNYAYVDLKLINDYLVVVDSKSNYHLRFFDKDSLNYLFSRIRKGKGPNEILAVGSIQVKGDNLYILDQITGKLFEYDINQLTGLKLPKPTQMFNIKNSVNDAKLLSPDNILYTGGIEDGLVTIIDSTGLKKKVIGNIPNQYSESYNDLAYLNLFHSFKIDLFPNGNTFIINSRYSGRLQVFNTNGNELFNITSPDFTEPRFIFSDNDISLDKKSKYCYSDVVVKEKYIYAIYSGISEIEYMKDPSVFDRKSIFLFKHDGTPVAQYNLNTAVSALDVDEEKSLIYVLQPPNKVLIYKYEIP